MGIKKLPGSHRMRRNARRLKCHQTMNNLWTVWGGKESHTVKKIDDYYKCDCDNYPIHGICSHIIRVQMGLSEFPTNDDLNSEYKDALS